MGGGSRQRPASRAEQDVPGLVGCILLLGGLALVPSDARAQQTYEEWAERQRRAFLDFRQGVTRAYRRFYRRQREAWESYRDSIAELWGREEVEVDSVDRWVAYSEDFRRRKSMDFRKGVARAEILVPPGQASDTARLKRELRQQVRDLLTTRGEHPHLESEPTGELPLLADQVETPEGVVVDSANASAFAADLVTAGAVETDTVRGEDGVGRVAASVEVPLVPDHLRRRASRFRRLVQRHAARFDLPAPLVFAVIHTESWFNPTARSPAPAYGLMQLVPESGGRAAYNYVYGEDRLLEPDYLYEPPNNVELGGAYLALLMGRYFGEVEDARSRRYLAVAAYNTGAGNVARALVGGTDVDAAVVAANRMSPDRLYERLRSALPYRETRDYLKKVTDRVPLYREWRLEERVRADRSRSRPRGGVEE